MSRYDRPDGEGCFLIVADFLLALVALSILVGIIIGKFVF